MLFVSIKNLDEISSIPAYLEGIELRLDLFPILNLDLIKAALEKRTLPILLTLRSASQGGKFQGSEIERQKTILSLLELKPDFFDLECDMDPIFLESTLKRYPETKFVLSYHNFIETEEDLESIYTKMKKYKAHSYKIANMAKSSNDALRALVFLQKHDDLSMICMGEKGSFARVLGFAFGNQMNYACLDENAKVAPGQLSVLELVNIYRCLSLNKSTSIYGLIGDPVSHSVGHIYHNDIFQKKGLNAVYVKMAVKKEELSEFFSLAKKLKIKGLSVTSPLKEKVLPYVKSNLKTINTLSFEKESIAATSTDGPGAIDALEKHSSILNKKIVILGAGGAARAIAIEAKKRGAHLWILNRSKEKAEKLSIEIGSSFGSLEEMPEDYDIIINCVAELPPTILEKLLCNKIAMDIVYVPKETAFLKAAKEKNCHLVYGEEMFVNQAKMQTLFWEKHFI